VGGWDFDVIGDGRAGGTATIGRIRDAPPSLAPGTYRVVGAISIVSDGRSGAPDASGHYPLVLMYWDLCEANLKVTSEMISVRIDIEYSLKGGFKIATALSLSVSA